MFFEMESGFFFFGDAFLRFVLSAIPSRLDLQSGLRRCPANESQKDGHRAERLSQPVFCDRSEQPMFHRRIDIIPLRRAARIMTYRDRQVHLSREFSQQFFPHPNPTAIASARVRQDQQSFRMRIFFPADDLPPTANRIDRKP